MAKIDLLRGTITCRLNPGRLVMSSSIDATSKIDVDFAEFVLASLLRHVDADWGVVPLRNKVENNKALISGGRLFSAYRLDELTVWILTEEDRSSTLVLFPEEYDVKVAE